MKNYIILILQKILGFERYLFVFSIFIIKKLRWDVNEKDFMYFLKIIPDDGIVLDIGANIGVMTYYFSKTLPHASVLSFEPIPYNIRTLKKIISFFKLKNVRILDFALGNKNGEIKMLMPEIHHAKKQGLSHVIDTKSKEKLSGEEFIVPLRRLDSIDEVTGTGQKVTAIKIDVENYEYYVLEGAESILKNHKPFVYCELWLDDMRVKTINLMKSFGYQAKVVENNSLVPYTQQKKQNLFFIPGKAL